jgi:hypothetical protein
MLSGYVLLQEPELLDRRGAVGRGSRLRTHTDPLGFEFVIHASVAQSTDLTPSQDARDGTARAVRESVAFRRASAARPANGLIAFPLPSDAQRYTFTGELSIRTCANVTRLYPRCHWITRLSSVLGLASRIGWQQWRGRES